KAPNDCPSWKALFLLVGSVVRPMKAGRLTKVKTNAPKCVLQDAKLMQSLHPSGKGLFCFPRVTTESALKARQAGLPTAVHLSNLRTPLTRIPARSPKMEYCTMPTSARTDFAPCVHGDGHTKSSVRSPASWKNWSTSTNTIS